MDNLRPLITKMDIIRAAEVLPLLQERLAIMPGGRDRRGGLLLLFPTTPRRERAKPEDSRRLLQYLTAIPNDDDRVRRFTIVVDMRGATWDSVKPILKVTHPHRLFCARSRGRRRRGAARARVSIRRKCVCSFSERRDADCIFKFDCSRRNCRFAARRLYRAWSVRWKKVNFTS